ncbi:hypothetical protein OG558_23070 [Kribbella sp. NBC_01510]|uniref:hypothetical protein n=1 Tax=Kribbella sp. NBC_01510 TaxID=2903581 RepID=UPI003862F4D2
MQWDLGIQGLAVLAAMSLGFGIVAGLLVGGGFSHRGWATAITAVACFGAGLLASEVWFGWATEEDLQPNIGGLSRDEVLLSSVLTTVIVVVVMRWVSRRARRHETSGIAADDRRGGRPVRRG